MNDRDTFAAAALTGLIAAGDYSVDSTPLLAYRMADAMLRERGNHSEPNSSFPHTQGPQSLRHGTPSQCTVQGERSVPGSRSENDPVAWWLKGCEYDTGCEYEYVSLTRESADEAAKEGGTVTPLYRSPALTDAEREAIEWFATFGDSNLAPLTNNWINHAATLRGLLERTAQNKTNGYVE